MSKTITINFSEKEYMILNHAAEENTMTIQDFIRYKLAGTIHDLYDIFTPEEAVRRAIRLPFQIYTVKTGSILINASLHCSAADFLISYQTITYLSNIMEW